MLVSGARNISSCEGGRRLLPPPARNVARMIANSTASAAGSLLVADATATQLTTDCY